MVGRSNGLTMAIGAAVRRHSLVDLQQIGNLPAAASVTALWAVDCVANETEKDSR